MLLDDGAAVDEGGVDEGKGDVVYGITTVAAVIDGLDHNIADITPFGDVAGIQRLILASAPT